MANSSINVIDDQESYLPNTFKQYYYALSDADESSSTTVMKRKSNTPDIDDFFDQAKPKKKKSVCSTVGRSCQGGISYVSTNKDEQATHLVKIEIYDLKKLSKVPLTDHWKHADVRVKYYCKEKEQNYRQAKDVIYRITKEIAESENCKKYHYKS